MNPYDLFLSRIQGFRSVPVKPGFERAGRCFCPSHQPPGSGSTGRSLSVAEGQPGVLVIHCHAGCSPAEVVFAAGLDLSDLFPPTAKAKARAHVHHNGVGDGWYSSVAIADAIVEACEQILLVKSHDHLLITQQHLLQLVDSFKKSVRAAAGAGKGGAK